MRPSSLSPARGTYPQTDTSIVTPAPQGAPAHGTRPSSSTMPGQTAFANMPRSPGPSTPSGSRSPLSFAWRRSPWSQQLRDAYAAGHAPQAQHAAQHAAPPAAGDIDQPRLYGPRQRTLQAALDGQITLARGRALSGSTADDDAANKANAAKLIDQIAAIAWAGTQSRGEASSSSFGPRTAEELNARIASNDPAVILELAQEAANHACGAAEDSRTGSMAALVARQQRALSAGNSSRRSLPMRALNQSMQAARAHIRRLETAVDMLEMAFVPFDNGDEDDDDATSIRGARAMLDHARAALGTIESDAVHCFVAEAIAEHRLPPEAAVLGRVAALRELHPAVFNQGGSDPQVLEGLAKLASSTARGLRAMMGALHASDHDTLQTLGGGAVDLPQTLRDASHAVMNLRADCPQGATHDALGNLFNAIDEANVWLEGQAQPIAGTSAALPPHSPLITSAAHTPPTNETVNARMAELAQQRLALARLPVIAHNFSIYTDHPRATARELGAMIEREMANARGEHTPLDTRVQLARLAMHFAPDDAGERVRLARALTSLALGVDAPTTSEVRTTLGFDDDYSDRGSAALTRQALFDRLGDVMSDLDRDGRLRFARSLEGGWDVRDCGGSSDVRRAALAIAHGRTTSASPPLPTAPSDPHAFGLWLGESGHRKAFIAEYIEAYSISRNAYRPSGDDDQIASYTDNRSVIGQLIRHASNMTALRGHRHHFVKLVNDLFKADDERISRRYRPAVGSAQRFELLQAMVAQLPLFGHASGDRQTASDVLGLVLREMSKKELQPRHKLALANELIAVTESLSTSRFSGSDAAQSHAIDSIAQAMQIARGPDRTALLRQMLASSRAWSAQRSAGAELARTRGKKRFVIGSSLFPPVGIIHAATYAVETINGRRSPKNEALKMVLETIELELNRTVEAGRPAPSDLIPVYGDLLRQLLDESAVPGGNSHAASLERTLSCIVRGGLPAGGSARSRNERITIVFSDDPSVRAAVARSLTRAIKDKTGPAADPFGRLASARYLQNLLAAGPGELDVAERQAAIAAIHRAASSKSLDTAGRRETAMLDTLVSEALRDDMPLQPEILARTASQTINVLKRVPQAVQEVRAARAPAVRSAAAAPVHDAAERMPRLMSFYPTLKAPVRRELAAALQGCAPQTPAQHGEPDAVAQLPLLAFVTSLSRFTGTRRADANEVLQLHAQAWGRLNATNQSAALNDLFNAYDEATPAGRQAVTSFVRGLDDRTFVTAAVKLIGGTVADETMRSALGEAECGRIIGTVLEHMRTLPGEDASDLVSGVLAGGAQLPRALIDGFISAAPTLRPRTLAQVLSTELGRVGALPADEAATALTGWTDAARALPPNSPQRQTLALFTAIATRAHPELASLAVPASRVPVPEQAAQQLSSALPGFDESVQNAVLGYIAGEHAPPAMRREIVDDLFTKFAEANPRQRRLAIELGGPAGIGRALETLAKTFGAPLFRAGQVVRPGFDQPFLQEDRASRTGGALSTLRSALEDRRRRPAEICIALEAIADRFQALPKTPFQEQFAEFFESVVRNRRLPEHMLRRVVDTLTLAGAQQSEVGGALLQRYGRLGSPGITEVSRDEARAHLDALRSQRGALLEGGTR